MHQGGIGIIVQSSGPDDLKRSPRERLGLTPVLASDCQQGALGQGGRGGGQRAVVDGRLHRLIQDCVGPVFLAGQQVGDSLEQQRWPQQGALWSQPVTGDPSVGAHPLHAVAAQTRMHQREVALHGAAVGERPPRSRAAFGRSRPALGSCRLPDERLEPGSKCGHRRVASNQVPLLEPCQPAADSVDPSGGVGELHRLATSRATRSVSPAAWAWSIATSGSPLPPQRPRSA